MTVGEIFDPRAWLEAVELASRKEPPMERTAILVRAAWQAAHSDETGTFVETEEDQERFFLFADLIYDAGLWPQDVDEPEQ